MNRITFVLPSRNNLEFLKLAYMSIKNLEGEHDILILNDASVDGTSAWIKSLNDPNLMVHTNPGPERIGIVGMFDKGIEMAKTDIIGAFHADMVAGKNLDINILKYLERKKVVCATRVEPPLHPPGPEKIIRNFGIEANQFDMFKWYSAHLEQHNRITNGIFAPWFMYKDDFLAVGGHDKLFAPQSREDSDLFNRFLLEGYEFIQSWDALVYHFTSRGSRFNPFSGGGTGKDSPEWRKTNSENEKKFILKWGTLPMHDEHMLPIVTPQSKKHYEKFISQNINQGNYTVEHFILGEYEFDYAHWNHSSCKIKNFTIEDIEKQTSYLKKGDIVIDIGAFTGDTPILYANAVGAEGKVFSFEPNPHSFEILKANSSLNKHLNIIPVNKAITAKEGKYTFHYSDNNFCNGGFSSEIDAGIGSAGHRVPLEVEGINLTEWIKKNIPEKSWDKISFIKIDTEGYDYKILEENKNLFKYIRPILEVELYIDLSLEEVKKMYTILKEIDYICFEQLVDRDCSLASLNTPLDKEGLLNVFKNVSSGENIVAYPKERYNNEINSN